LPTCLPRWCPSRRSRRALALARVHPCRARARAARSDRGEPHRAADSWIARRASRTCRSRVRSRVDDSCCRGRRRPAPPQANLHRCYPPRAHATTGATGVARKGVSGSSGRACSRWRAKGSCRRHARETRMVRTRATRRVAGIFARRSVRVGRQPSCRRRRGQQRIRARHIRVAIARTARSWLGQSGRRGRRRSSRLRPFVGITTCDRSRRGAGLGSRQQLAVRSTRGSSSG